MVKKTYLKNCFQAKKDYEANISQRILKKPCVKCDHYFIPSGRQVKVCDECRQKKYKEFSQKWINKLMTF